MDDDRSPSKIKNDVIDNIDIVVFHSFIAIIIVIVTVALTCASYDATSLYIQDLYVTSLAAAVNRTTTFNTSIFIDLKFTRQAAFSSPSYADFDMTLFYGKKRGLLVANHVVDGFSLGRRKEFHLKATVDAPRLPWEEASRTVSSGSEVVLMVQLVVIKPKQQPYVFAAHVAVDTSGHKVSKNPIEFECIGVLSY